MIGSKCQELCRLLPGGQNLASEIILQMLAIKRALQNFPVLPGLIAQTLLKTVDLILVLPISYQSKSGVYPKLPRSACSILVPSPFAAHLFTKTPAEMLLLRHMQQLALLLFSYSQHSIKENKQQQQTSIPGLNWIYFISPFLIPKLSLFPNSTNSALK